MQLHHVLTTLLYAICCVEGVAGRQAGLRRRQENTDVATTAPPESTPPPDSSAVSTTTDPPGSSSIESSTTTEGTSPSSTADIQSTATSLPSPSSQDATPSTTDGAAKPTHTAKKANQLPIRPAITPAIGLAGVFLIGTGVALCLIGIKHQWLHVFISAAFCTSLAVTVLIIYVMSPPISNAIQGAYFVAVVVTGLIFGALSLVFKDITEGLGCLIGGFCLSMWFMVLRPGGLVQADPGRAIMIGVFSAVGLSLSFSQYTRNYGLIGCTAFAGAMATVLGIDCFSRAGLKEFWLYIWNLNNDIFPLGTKTYPITRGIRVEIAVTVVIFLFGIMSQLKIWKIVKERREKKEAERQAEDERRDHLAGEVGQDVEALNRQQRDQWEALYGSKSRLPVDSGVGTSVASTHKKSASVTTREVDTIEMDDNPRTAKQSTSKLTNISSRNNTDEDLQGNNERRLAGSADWSSRAGSQISVGYTEAEEAMPIQQPGGPEVVPLPFSPPEEKVDAPTSDAGSAKSAGTAVTALNPLALKQHNERMPSRLPRIEDDRASSIAATADDEPDVDADSIKRKSIVRPSFRVRSTPTPDVERTVSPRDDLFPEDEKTRERSRTPSGQRDQQETAVDDEDDEELVRPQTALETDIGVARASSSADKPMRDSSVSSRRRSTGSRKSAEHEDANEGSAVGSFTGHLPDAISKVAMAYRTNEWAKHIADAEQPDEIPQEPDSPGVQVDTAFREEAARPVDTEALSEVPVVSPTEGPRKPSKRESKNPYRQSSGKAPSIHRSSSGTPVYAFQRNNSRQSLTHQSSSDQLKGARRPSAPLGDTLIESPIEENAEHFVTPMTSSNNLLDQRNDRLKRKTTTTNFNALDIADAAESSPLQSGLDAPTANFSSGSSQAPSKEMTLAQRKTLIQQQQQQQQQQHAPPTSSPPRVSRQISNPVPVTRTHSTSNPNLIYDSHQPKRSNTIDPRKQSAMYSQWRSSLMHTANRTNSPVVEDQARQQMINQREAAAQDRQRRQEKRLKRESQMDIAMRSGQLHDKHTDVLRKMQAKANAGQGGSGEKR